LLIFFFFSEFRGNNCCSLVGAMGGRVLLERAVGGGDKTPQPSQIPEVGVACHTRGP